MTSDVDSNDKLNLLPLQMIETADAVILRRGNTRIKVAGEGAVEGIRLLIGLLSQDGVTPAEICASFPPVLQSAVEQMIRKLISSRMAVRSNDANPLSDIRESNLDVFYWNFGTTASAVEQRLKIVQVAILGMNYVSMQLATALLASGFENCQIVDIPLLRNSELCEATRTLSHTQWPALLKPPIPYEAWETHAEASGLDCLVACSDFVSTEQFREWNQICVERKWSFLPVILDEFIGRVGPFTIPGETACYECLYSRQNSNQEDPATQRAVDSAAIGSQSVIGLLPSMATLLGDLASLELTKLYGGVLPAQIIGRLIEVNLLATQLASRRVLKIPRCPVCSPLNTKPSSNSRRAILAQCSRSVEQ